MAEISQKLGKLPTLPERAKNTWKISEMSEKSKKNLKMY